jgi:hypothetical protein
LQRVGRKCLVGLTARVAPDVHRSCRMARIGRTLLVLVLTALAGSAGAGERPTGNVGVVRRVVGKALERGGDRTLAIGDGMVRKGGSRHAPADAGSLRKGLAQLRYATGVGLAIAGYWTGMASKKVLDIW